MRSVSALRPVNVISQLLVIAVLFCGLLMPQSTSAYTVLWERPRAVGSMGYVFLAAFIPSLPGDFAGNFPTRNLGADLDGDGVVEFACAIDWDGTIYVYIVDALTGTIEFTHSWQGPGNVQIITYFDGDPSTPFSEVFIETPSKTLVISGGGVSGVPSEDVTAGADLSNAARPNPSHLNTAIAFTLQDDVPVTVAIYDVQGRRIRLLLEAPMPAGSHTIGWDGRDAQGARVAAGTYFARIDAAGSSSSEKIVRLP